MWCVDAQSFQSGLTLCDSMGCSLPGSSVHRILQARALEWVPCPPPGCLPDPEKEPQSLCLLHPSSTTWEAQTRPWTTACSPFCFLYERLFPRSSEPDLPVSLFPLVFLPLGWCIGLYFHLLTYKALGPLLPWKHLDWESSL